MGIVNIEDAVVVVIVVKVVGNAVRVKVARPGKLVNSSVVIVVFIVASCTRSIAVFVGYTVVVVVHWILVSKIEISNGPNVGVVMHNACIQITVGGNVSWVKAESLKSLVINRSFQNSVVVVIPVINVRDSIVIVVVWVRSIATVESLEEIVNSVVVIVQIVQVINAIVVVVTKVGFLKHWRIEWNDRLKNGKISDDS